ncbi:MAG: RecX family transcriptional regulator [Muribaculaceae bacterium]|nr:RecX family transcriptional regulator [Muribaculaceae bacterium]
MAFGKKKEVTPAQALVKMEDLCSRSEHSSNEIRKKLVNMRLSGDAINKIIDSLIDRRYIDDHRYAIAYARDKYRFSKWGRLKIRQALSLGGIPRDYINDALEQIDQNSYIEILDNMLKAKARSIKEGNTFEGRTKLYRFGLSRGFESNLVAASIKNNASKFWQECSID